MKNKSRLTIVKNDKVESESLFNQETSEQIINALLSALKCKDDYTWGHSLRVAYFSLVLGRGLDLSPKELHELELSALFHDIGKIGISEKVLKKPERLTNEEFLEMKMHPDKSYDILKENPMLENLATHVRYHHERFDGRGYPSGLKSDEIPLYSRIILISDTFDAMTSTRPYRKGLELDVAFAELREFSGTQFDPFLVEKFISCMLTEQKLEKKTFSLQVIPGEFDKEAA